MAACSSVLWWSRKKHCCKILPLSSLSCVTLEQWQCCVCVSSHPLPPGELQALHVQYVAATVPELENHHFPIVWDSGSYADGALLWQSIPCPSLAVIFQSNICFRQVCGVHKATDEPNCSLGFGQGLFQQMTARTPTDIIKSTLTSGYNCFEHAQAALLRSLNAQAFSYLKMWP